MSLNYQEEFLNIPGINSALKGKLHEVYLNLKNEFKKKKGGGGGDFWRAPEVPTDRIWLGRRD